MTLFALVYRYVDDEGLIGQHRPEHRRYLRSLVDAGELVLAGPFEGPGPFGGLLVLDAETDARAQEIADHDPFYLHNVIAERSLRPWTLSMTSERSPLT
jgi:hypothetical protein